MATLVETTEMDSVFGNLAFAELSGLKVFNLFGQAVNIVQPNAPFNVEVELEYKGTLALNNAIGAQDIQVQFLFEGLGGPTDVRFPATPAVWAAGVLPGTGGQIVNEFEIIQNVPAGTLSPGVYRVAAIVKSINSSSQASIMVGFIEGLVIEQA